MMKRVTLMILTIALGGCGKKNFTETTDRDVTIQVQQILNNGETSQSDFKVRIIPAVKDNDRETTAFRERLWYQIDSCFYIKTGGKKSYPSLIQPVANGVKGSYEYLVSFEANPGKSGWKLVYHDKYINHKNYDVFKN